MSDILVLPGFSPQNQLWATRIKHSLESLGPVRIIAWQHWVKGGDPAPNWIETELALLRPQLDHPVILVTKSIGTLIAARLVGERPEVIDRLVLCGLPLNDLTPADIEPYRHLDRLDPKKVLVLQNNADPHGNDTQVAALFNQLGLRLTLTSRIAADHEYLYLDEIKKFLLPD